MLSQRGYNTIVEDEMLIGEKDHDKLIVFYNTGSKLSIENIKNYTRIMFQIGFRHAVIVYNGSVTPQANKIIESLQELEIELFEKSCLRFNITKHRLVPPHRCLTSHEELEFKTKYGVKIPVLLRTDPVVRFYNFRSGSIIEITRPEGIVVYRIVK